MKKVLLSAVVALGSIAYAQQAPTANLDGKWWISGGFSFDNNSQTKASSYEIMPTVGTFISPSVTVGLGVGYEGTSNEVTNPLTGKTETVSASSFSVVPLARKYWNVAPNFYLFGQAAVPMTFSENVKTFGFQLSPGVDYFITENFTIEASVGALGYENVSPKVGDSYGRINAGINMSNINFGLKYIF